MRLGDLGRGKKIVTHRKSARMKPCNEPVIVPPQSTGAEKNIEHTVTASTTEVALQLYNACRQRLLLVNDWDQVAQGLSAEFRLTDAAGREVKRPATAGDHIRINIPAPGSKAGDGYDWVLVEVIDECGNPGDPIQSLTMQVRPCANPLQPDEQVAHFLDEAATSSFVAARNGRVVTVGIYGRNEKPNTNTKAVTDKLRNTVVALGAIAGIANLQWEALAKGILQAEK
jgi:hypothetical protein